MSMRFITKINNDENMEIKTIEKVCSFLGIPVEMAVEFVREKNKSTYML